MVSGATIFDYFVFNISTATSIPSAESTHAGFELKQNYPNPFNPSTQITFYLSRQSNVKLNVFDMLGREVAVLIDENQSPGTHHINFNAEDLPSGVYFYRLQTADFLETKKMILAK